MEVRREFDIIIWGATGYVGRLTAHQLASRLPDGGGLRWAIGGRNRAKLESVRDGLGANADNVPIVIGDSHDVSSMEALAGRARVVCSTVGPYAKFGSELVAACAAAGTDYCDLSAEAHWIRKMIDRHQTEAERSGARIVHACGMDSIPSDLGVFLLQRRALEEHGVPCSLIKTRVVSLKGGFSGGTAASFLYAAEEGPNDPTIASSNSDPYSLNPAGRRRGPDPRSNMRTWKWQYDKDVGGWVKPFFMAPMNTKIVRRTNAVLDYPYGRDFRYEEDRLIDPTPLGFLKAAAGTAGRAVFMRALSSARGRRVLSQYALPASGEGPSEETRESGFWELLLIGKLANGEALRAHVRGDGDPATGSTSRMLAESALCLAEDSDQIGVGGGIWTPASAMGTLLVSRLDEHAGVTFEVESTTPKVRVNSA